MAYILTAAQWTSSNFILRAGVIGTESDTGKFKIGVGGVPWNSLPYAGGATSETSGNCDGGYPDTVYGGDIVIDGGSP